MRYSELNLSRNSIVRILERDEYTVIYQGKTKRGTDIPDEEVLSIKKIGAITEIVLSYGETMDEKIRSMRKTCRKTGGSLRRRLGLINAMLYGLRQ